MSRAARPPFLLLLPPPCAADPRLAALVQLAPSDAALMSSSSRVPWDTSSRSLSMLNRPRALARDDAVAGGGRGDGPPSRPGTGGTARPYWERWTPRTSWGLDPAWWWCCWCGGAEEDQSRPARDEARVKLLSPAVVLVPWLLTESPSLRSMKAGFDRADPEDRKWYAGPPGAALAGAWCSTMPGGGRAMLVRASFASDPSPESTDRTLESAELRRARLYLAVAGVAASPPPPGVWWAGTVLTCTTGSTQHPAPFPDRSSPAVPWLFLEMLKS
mmetsp:Transcript_4554/g.10213  ORF Transcript_4554/g.10213 Transcript_4554/m.10213 type:complete len:273 (-) Transcript_4554:704-1522(-)